MPGAKFEGCEPAACADWVDTACWIWMGAEDEDGDTSATERGGGPAGGD